MSKYKIGDKFIVEVTSKVLCGEYNSTAYELNDMCVIGEAVLDKCEKVEGTYEDGLKNAWDAACKIGKMSCDGGFNLKQLSEMFDASIPTQIFKKYSAKEVVEKIKKYEHEIELEKIQFGDEVVRDNALTCYGVVLHTFDEGCDVFWKNTGDVESFVGCLCDDLIKTGKNYAKDVSALLNRIGE